MEKFIIIDGNSLINRAFYGLPMLRSLNGTPCNAVFGFTNILLGLISNEKPKYLVCVFDAGKHTFRHDMYAEYKGTRDKMPEDLASQLPVLKNLLKNMGIMTIEIPEIEADDIIGSLTRKFDEQFILVSGDKDLLQLINKQTQVWLTQKGISQVQKVDESVLKSEFNLRPYQVIEMKAIMGDSSDNIPGVPGIGKVGASKLIEEFDNLDNIYKNIDNVAPKLKNKLLENKDYAYLSKTLATIKLDVDLNVTLQECEYSLPFSDNVKNIMREMDFKTLINRKEFFTPQTMQQNEEISLHSTENIEIDSLEKFNFCLNLLTGDFAIDFDDLSLKLGNKDIEFVLYTSGEIFNNNLSKIKQLIENDKQKICYDAKKVMHYLKHYNITLNNYFDVSLAQYIANEIDADISLEDALKLNNLHSNSKVFALFILKDIYLNKLKENNQLKLYNEIELPLVQVLFEMEVSGLNVDVQQIKSLSEVYAVELENLTKQIYELAGKQFNINSPKQLHYILFEKLNIAPNKKIKGTSVEVLNSIKDKHKIVQYILRYRKIAKLKNTYLDGMLNYVASDNKIHTTFMQKTTATGRLSSREPNLQNLPIRDDEGKLLRKMFSASTLDGCLISADYNQIELRLMANFSKDENMINDYLSNVDIHKMTASKIFNTKLENVTHDMRRMAKSVNFGIIYGISAFGLSENVGCTPKEASEFIKKYFQIYPRVKAYGEECVNLARENGYVSTLMGRVRHINDINSGNHFVRSFAERVAKNTPLQGSASDIIKLAMVRVYNRLKKENLKSKLVLQIHDELIVDCVKGESEKVKEILKTEMENVVNLTVPLLVEIGEGYSLFDAK